MQADWFDKKAEKQAQATEKKIDKKIDKKIVEVNKGSATDKNNRVAQLNKSKADIADMRKDTKNEYKFDKASNNKGNPETKRTGASEITIYTDDFSKEIHENRHGGQIARGEYDTDTNGKLISWTVGVSKEIDAYQAQYSYDGKIDYCSDIPVSSADAMKAVMAGKDPTVSTISSFNQITPAAINSMTDPGYVPIYPLPGMTLTDWNNN